MNAIVRYSNGVTMSYSVNAFMPIEGYRVAFNGTEGRLEVRDYEAQAWKPAENTEIDLMRNFGQKERVPLAGLDRRRPWRRRHAPARLDLPKGRLRPRTCGCRTRGPAPCRA